MLRGGECLTLVVLPLTLDRRPLPLSALCHRGDLALGSWYGPPGQRRGIQVVAHGVDQSGEVDEVGDRLWRAAAGGSHRLREEVGGSVVEHGGAAHRVEGDGKDGVVQCEGAVAGCQVAHGDGLQVGELGGGVAGDVGGRARRSAGVSQDHDLKQQHSDESQYHQSLSHGTVLHS